MIVQPIQYLPEQPQALSGLQQGLEFGANLARVRAAQEAARLAKEERDRARAAQEQFVAERDKFYSTPNPTLTDVLRFQAVMPKDMAAATKDTLAQIPVEQRRGYVSMMAEVVSSLDAKQPNVAVGILENAKQANPAQQASFDRMINTIQSDPVNAFKLISPIISADEEGRKMLEAREKARVSGAAEDKAVADASAAQSDAKIKLATAGTAQEAAQAELDLKRANAKKAQAEAEFERKQQLADLQKKARDLGLTRAQTDQALASTAKLDAETQKIALELAALEATGGVDPTKKFDQEEKLRKEFTARTKVFNEVDSTFSNLQASAQASTGPGDIALITGFMKMLDPGSVVRETEFATARDTAGLYTRLENSLQKLQSGEFLKPTQRQEFINLASKYYDAAKKKADQEKKALGVVVKNYKLNPENVFGVETTPTPTPTPTAAPKGGRDIGGGFRVLD